MNIQPINIWSNGQSVTANSINARIIFDNLSDYAKFYWELNSETIIDTDTVVTVVSSGNTTINGENYVIWGQSADINLAAYEYICNELNLTLIP